MAEINSYKEWLVTAPTERGILETIEVSHPSWPAPVYLVHWDIAVTCTIQDKGADTPVEFLPARFVFEPAIVSDGTEQSASCAISAYDGVIYSFLKGMTPDERMVPIELRSRLYYTDDQTAQLINPSPLWNVHAVTATFETVHAELQVAPLRIQRVGRYFTALQFPVLGFAK